jgi:hypothetical protein
VPEGFEVMFASIIAKEVVFSSAVEYYWNLDKDLYELSINGEDVDFAGCLESNGKYKWRQQWNIAIQFCTGIGRWVLNIKPDGIYVSVTLISGRNIQKKFKKRLG